MRRFFQWAHKWWPGLIPLAALWVAAAWTSTVPLEQDLAARATAALQSDVLDQSRIEVAGRDVTFSAAAFSEQGRRTAVQSVEMVPGVRTVIDQTRLVPEAKPFVWTLDRDVLRVTLGGSAPLPAIKAKLAEATRSSLNGFEVVDQMGLSRGAPPRFDAAALLLIDQVSKLKDGKISLSDTAVKLSGMAKELGGREAIAAALKNLPQGYSVAANAIQAPPYVFQANKDPVAVTVTLSGNVPNNAVHTLIAEQTEQKFFNEKVVDQLKASIGAPAGFSEAVVTALEALSRLSTGTLMVTDREITVSGDAFYAAAVNDIRVHLMSGLPKYWRAKADISVKPPAGPVDATVCQNLLTQLLAKGSIRFAAGEAAIDRNSAGLLDRLVETAQRCPSMQIDIVGHTDADGDDAANLLLSEKRAQAVVDYLVKAGLPAERFTALGYGSMQPIAPNGTPEGKAQNRRIEFQVKAP
ncbi:MAG TPA: OmpA family protein [Xanthobacteraceae bacterium]|nr:OmpA family protein [Xanthobacteraceae bacterium]